jgi:hypothetical protein
MAVAIPVNAPLPTLALKVLRKACKGEIVLVWAASGVIK